MLSMQAMILFFTTLLLLTQAAANDNANCTKDVCHLDGATLRFLIIGDWGGQHSHPYTTRQQRRIARSAGRVAAEERASFIISTGDHFYEKGVKSVDDKRFQLSFERVYTAPSLHVPWYCTAGNHDWDGNISAQIAYTERSARWKFPDHFYTISYTVAQREVHVNFVEIDTVVLCGNTHGENGSREPTGPENTQLAHQAWAWVERKLANFSSISDHLFVFGHYPAWSAAGEGPVKCLIDGLVPLLKAYNVSAYISGHDHILEHLVVHDSMPPMHYVVSGAGAKTTRHVRHRHRVPTRSLRFVHPIYAAEEGGFNLVSVDRSAATFYFLDDHGERVHRALIPSRTIDKSIL